MKQQINHSNPTERYSISVMLSDQAAEYTGSEWNAVCKNNDIDCRQIAREVHEQAGVVERLWETLGDMARAMMYTANMPKEVHVLRTCTIILQVVLLLLM